MGDERRGTIVIAQECAASGVALVHFFSDYVFGGDDAGPRHEGRAAILLGICGASKLAGDRGVYAVGGRFVVLRPA